MPKITYLKARQVLDSRGNPTIEVDLVLNEGEIVRAIVPSGASTGSHEAFEKRDQDSTVYGGKGVLKAVQAVNQTINDYIKEREISSLAEFDKLICELDGTSQKSNLGANAILAVSMAYAKAEAQLMKKPLYQYFAMLSGQRGTRLPVPLMNILNGGAHADNNVDFQEMMIVPKGFSSFSRALQAGTEVFHALKTVLKNKGYQTAVGDEGGFAPNIASNEEGLDLISVAIKNAGYTLGKDIFLALDVAATEFYDNGFYCLENAVPNKKSALEMVTWYKDLIGKYPIVSIEDGLAEDDWSGWKALTETLGTQTQLVGDDLFVTNTKLLNKGIEQKIGNAILVKINQIGTLSETLETIALAKKSGYATIISHRSGETEDTTIADLAVGTDSGQIKTGSLSRTDRVCKYNQLLRIEEELGSQAIFG